MRATRRVAVIEDSRYREHRVPAGHPECPERLAWVGEAIERRGDRLLALSAREATDDEILAVHPREHFEELRLAAREAPIHLDPDTYLAPRSLEIARLAAGGTLVAAEAVARGEADAAFAAVRPPGHHAEAARAMGFCLLNNVAIAARALQRVHGLAKILIVDWDVHHGNGTQHLFEDDPSVLYFSTHQFPAYPGTGKAEEIGRGRGEGATVNVPMPPGCGDDEYAGVFERVLVPVVRGFRPEMILVSCGFDAHRDDPLAMMQVTEAGFRALARTVRALAEEACAGRTLLVLEGGYSPVGLAEGTGAVLDTALAPDAPAVHPPAPLEPESRLSQVVGRVAQAHAAFHPELHGFASA